MEKELVRKVVEEFMAERESATHKLKCRVVDHLAETMDVDDLKHLAIKETGEIIQHFAMGHLEEMIKSYVELKMAMKAVCKHLPEGMTDRAYREAVEHYAKSFGVDME